MVEKERVKKSEKSPNLLGDYIAYWVQSSPRIEYNYSFQYAKEMCEKFNKPLLIFSVLNSHYPEARRRAYEFFIGGLEDFKISLKELGLDYSIFLGDPEEVLEDIVKDSVLLITDKGYLKYNRELNEKIEKKIPMTFIEIESNVIVPVEEVTDHEEYGAYTIRKKITSKVGKFLKNPHDEYMEMSYQINSYNKNYRKIDIDDFINSIEDNNYYPLTITPGEKSAKKKLKIFLEEKLENYSIYSNHPFENFRSGLSAYLHFGQISPGYIYTEVKEFEKKCKEKNYSLEKMERISESVESFLEELVVRRELAFNFCYFNRDYEDFNKILPKWAYETFKDHKDDKREYIYTLSQLEKFQTHDNYWNEVQKELITKGTMNSYMRMYWAKKILEWSSDVETAYNTALYLNNRYFLDGRDPNSYAGIAWCFGKHDRPWTERNIFGKVRYMNASGVERKGKVKIKT